LKYRDFLQLARLRSGLGGLRLIGNAHVGRDGTWELGLVVRAIDPAQWEAEAEVALVESTCLSVDAPLNGRDETPRAKLKEKAWISSMEQLRRSH
jgi:autotransporter translocation and assembly factor TamB